MRELTTAAIMAPNKNWPFLFPRFTVHPHHLQRLGTITRESYPLTTLLNMYIRIVVKHVPVVMLLHLFLRNNLPIHWNESNASAYSFFSSDMLRFEIQRFSEQIDRFLYFSHSPPISLEAWSDERNQQKWILVKVLYTERIT